MRLTAEIVVIFGIFGIRSSAPHLQKIEFLNLTNYKAEIMVFLNFILEGKNLKPNLATLQRLTRQKNASLAKQCITASPLTSRLVRNFQLQSGWSGCRTGNG